MPATVIPIMVIDIDIVVVPIISPVVVIPVIVPIPTPIVVIPIVVPVVVPIIVIPVVVPISAPVVIVPISAGPVNVDVVVDRVPDIYIVANVGTVVVSDIRAVVVADIGTVIVTDVRSIVVSNIRPIIIADIGAVVVADIGAIIVSDVRSIVIVVTKVGAIVIRTTVDTATTKIRTVSSDSRSIWPVTSTETRTVGWLGCYARTIHRWIDIGSVVVRPIDIGPIHIRKRVIGTILTGPIVLTGQIVLTRKIDVGPIVFWARSRSGIVAWQARQSTSIVSEESSTITASTRTRTRGRTDRAGRASCWAIKTTKISGVTQAATTNRWWLRWAQSRSRAWHLRHLWLYHTTSRETAW